MIRFYALFLSVTLGSCFTSGHIDYLGNSFAPTKNVDVFVDASAIKKPYTIIGKSHVNGTHLFSSNERIQQAAIEKAKQKGVDAILFQDYIVLSGNTIQTVTKSDSIGSSSAGVKTTAIAPIESERLDILFLKYN